MTSADNTSKLGNKWQWCFVKKKTPSTVRFAEATSISCTANFFILASPDSLIASPENIKTCIASYQLSMCGACLHECKHISHNVHQPFTNTVQHFNSLGETRDFSTAPVMRLAFGRGQILVLRPFRYQVLFSNFWVPSILYMWRLAWAATLQHVWKTCLCS